MLNLSVGVFLSVYAMLLDVYLLYFCPYINFIKFLFDNLLIGIYYRIIRKNNKSNHKLWEVHIIYKLLN